MDNELNRAPGVATVVRVAVVGRVARIQVGTISQLRICLRNRTKTGTLARVRPAIRSQTRRDGKFSTGLVENLWTGATPAQNRPDEW